MKEQFTEANGMRPNLPKILFLITDGSQTDEPGYEEPAPLAAKLRGLGNPNHFLDFISSGRVRSNIHMFTYSIHPYTIIASFTRSMIFGFKSIL